LANPIDAPTIRYKMDPRDVVPFVELISRGDSENDHLQTGQEIESYTLMPSSTGTAALLQIMEGDGRDPVLVDTDPDQPPQLGFWLSVDSSMWANPLFDGQGYLAGVEVTFVTKDEPPQTKQFTLLINVRNK
jgi:hypothetical protein